MKPQDVVAVKSSLWIFGYGSLVWKPDFKYKRSKVGYIKGYKRRFWHGDNFHRGDDEMVSFPFYKFIYLQFFSKNAQINTWTVLPLQLIDFRVSITARKSGDAHRGGWRKCNFHFYRNNSMNRQPRNIPMCTHDWFPQSTKYIKLSDSFSLQTVSFQFFWKEVIRFGTMTFYERIKKKMFVSLTICD